MPSLPVCLREKRAQRRELLRAAGERERRREAQRRREQLGNAGACTARSGAGAAAGDLDQRLSLPRPLHGARVGGARRPRNPL